MTKRLVLFDIDGTILLSGGAGRRAILAALAEETSIGADAVQHIRFDGKTDPQIVVELLDAGGDRLSRDQDRIHRVIDRYLFHLERDLTESAHQATVMPGVRPLLETLRGDGRVVLGLLTGNVVRGAAIKLRAVEIPPEGFAVGAYGSDHAIRAELPAIAAQRAVAHFGRVPSGTEVVIIGDTPADVTCGNGIGAVSVGVATGSYRPEHLAEAGAHHVFEDLSDTERVAAAILGMSA
ncbi:MAG: HAD family hydrolase [Gemmatimonadales bacterium]